MVDTRNGSRYAVDLPARMTIGHLEMACRIRNVSRSGVFVVGPAIMVDTRVSLRFSAPHLELLDVKCLSRWHNRDGSGLSFDNLRPIDTYMLAKFFRHASRQTQKFPTLALLRPPAER
jgi:hypothetical protein